MPNSVSRKSAARVRTLNYTLSAALLLVCSFTSAEHATENRFTFTILHTNDLHGHILPFAYTESGNTGFARTAQGRNHGEQPSVGGAARRATLVRALRSEIDNPVMLIDAGDVFTRGAFTNAYEGIADIEAMNAVGYELAAIGNNEFKAKDGVEEADASGAQSALLQVIKRSRFPWVCANARNEKGAFLEGVQPYVVRQYDGVRVGFLGLTAPRSARYPQTAGWTISDPIEAAKEWIPRARLDRVADRPACSLPEISDPIEAAKEWIPRARAYCDILIAVTHIGVGLDSVLAVQTSGLDAIVGGDSHTFLYQAVELKNREGVLVPIVQDGEFGVNLGRFDLSFRRSGERWELAGYRYELLPIGPGTAEADDVVRVVQPYTRPFEATAGRLDPTMIGTNPTERTRNTTRVIVDAMRHVTGADLAVNPEGGGIFEVFRHPTVSRYEIYSVMPFKNRVVVASLTGEEINTLLGNDSSAVVAGNPASLDPARSYTVALVDFIARYYAVPKQQLSETGRDLRDVVIAYLNR